MHRRLLNVLSVLITVVVLPAGAAAPVAGQSRPPKPVLILDTDTAEGKAEAEASKEKELSPARAAENLKIGDFYLKRKNYPAALERYRDAIECQPDLLPAYEALVRVYEKIGESPKAVETYREFIRRNPESPKIPEISNRIAKIEKRG